MSKVSLIIFLQGTPLLHPRHLIQSLKQQRNVELDVHFFHRESAEAPQDLPQEWKIHAISDDMSALDVWSEGLKLSQGPWVSSIREVVQFAPDHFEKSLAATGDYDAVIARPRFLDQELFPCPEAQLPLLQSSDLPGFFLSSQLLWPTEGVLFKRSSLQDNAPEELEGQNSLFQWVNWLQSHKLLMREQESFKAPLQAFISENNEDLNSRLEALLDSMDASQLCPSFACNEDLGQIELQQQHFIVQSLRNRQAKELAKKYLDSLSVPLPPASLFLLSEASETWQSRAQELLQAGGNPVLVIATAAKGLEGQAYQLQYSQRDGIPQIHIQGVPAAQCYPESTEVNQQLLQTVANIYYEERAARIHITSFRYYSLLLPGALVHQNVPLYYSYCDDSLFFPRLKLRYPEIVENPLHQKYGYNWLNNQNKFAQSFIEQQCAGLVIHRAQDAEELRELGCQRTAALVQNGSDLQKLYAQTPTRLASAPTGSNQAVLYEHLTQDTYPDRFLQDFVDIQKSDSILMFGRDIDRLMTTLLQQDYWIQGSVFSERAARQFRDRGLPIQTGSMNSLSERIHHYDILYTPYVLEGFRAQEIRRLISAAVLALKKRGKWVLKLLHPKMAQASDASFWLNEYHRRPYSPTLIEDVLKEAGFQTERQERLDPQWSDFTLSATLMTEALPLLNLPVASTKLSEYWDENPPALELGEEDQVLLLGPHIRKTWLINRMLCGSMLGVTQNLNELGTRPKKGDAHQFRHSRDLQKTLRLIKRKFDVIVLQACVETQTPEQLLELLELCRDKLNKDGRLEIQTLTLNSEDEDPLFWQSLLNVRPYHDLKSILKSCGWEISARQSHGEQEHYTCQRARARTSKPPSPKLPEALRNLIKHSGQLFHLKSYNDLLALEAESQPCIVATNLLEQTPLGKLQQVLKQLVTVMQNNGLLVLSFPNIADWDWDYAEAERPFPAITLDKLLQDAGLQKSSLQQEGKYWIWVGYKRLHLKEAEAQPVHVRWEGDVLNYHSLSQVNRELLKNLQVNHPDWRLEVRNPQAPDFKPQPEDGERPLLEAMYRPLLNEPDLIVKHQWPPNFELPDSGGHWVMIQPWEFGSLPERWVYNINKFVDQAWVPTEFVKQSYLDSGILPEKVAVVPNGVDTARFNGEAPPLILETEKSFRFLYVGGANIRKGLDLLLESYVESFSAEDDVCLVIKDFGKDTVYKAIDVAEFIETQRAHNPNMPEILHLSENIPVDQMPSLYSACHCLVHPFRGEGFALPVAEAMACEKPVLVTEFGAVLDYCTAENAYLLPADISYFEEKQVDDTLVTVDYPYWAKPDREALKALMRHIYENQSEAQERGLKGAQTIHEKWTWTHSVLQAEEQLKLLQQRPVFRFYRMHLLSEVLGQAFQLMEQEDYKAAAPLFLKALQVDPYQPSVTYNLGVCYLMAQDYETAVTYLTRSLREGEITADLCYAMGTALRHLGDQTTSQEFFAKARDLDPELFNVENVGAV